MSLGTVDQSELQRPHKFMCSLIYTPDYTPTTERAGPLPHLKLLLVGNSGGN